MGSTFHRMGMRQAPWHKNLHYVIKSSTLNFPEVVSAKVSLNNYKGLTGLTEPWEYVQNIRSILDFVTQDNDIMCKIISITLRGFAHTWFHKLEHGFILHFQDLSSKLISRSNTSITPVKAPHSSILSHNENIRALGLIFKGSTKKCLTWKSSNLTRQKPSLVESITISYRKSYTLF
jgi:hypothetical protein